MTPFDIAPFVHIIGCPCDKCRPLETAGERLDREVGRIVIGMAIGAIVVLLALVLA